MIFLSDLLKEAAPSLRLHWRLKQLSKYLFKESVFYYGNNMPVYDEHDLQNVTSLQSTKLFVSDTITVRFW